MALRLPSSLRNTRATDIITAAGTNPKLKFYNGAVPATGAAPAGTLLGTLNITGAFGTATAGVIDINETVTQTNSSHVSGTPTFCRVTTSADVFVADIDIGAGAGNMQFTGSIVNGTDFSLGTSTITEGNA